MERSRPCVRIGLLILLAAFAWNTAGAEGPLVAPPGESFEIRIAISDRAEIKRLTRLVSIDNVSGLEVAAVATPEQLRRLRAEGFSWQVVDRKTAAKDLGMCPSGWEADAGRSWDCYPSYSQYEGLLNQFAALRPELCRLVDLGPTTNTVRPHRLWAVVISDNPDLDEAEPAVLLTSTIHGDETGGYILMLRLIDHLLTNDSGDPEIAELIDETEIWINPNANPDGTYRGGDGTVSGAIRYFTTATGANSGVDGNRNFPDPTGDDHPDGEPWWPETEIMMDLAEAANFVLSANFHGGAEVVNYPWDTWQRRHPDNDWFIDLSSDWADLAQNDSPGGYMTTPYNSGITNGWDWYETRGSRQDWITYFRGSREVTIEISNTKLVPAENLDDLWQWNRRALLGFIGHAHQGIRGIVTDADGTPLTATIEVVGVDQEIDGSMVRTDPAVGDYHRLLLPGLYDLRISSAGYRATEISGVAVGEGAATVVDVTLHPDPVRRPSRRAIPVAP
jgi:hypothetical protein